MKLTRSFISRRPQMRAAVTDSVKQKKLPKTALNLFDKVGGDTVDQFVAEAREMSTEKNVRGSSQVKRGFIGSLLFGAATAALTAGAIVAAPAATAGLAGLAATSAVATVLSFGAVLLGGNEQHQASVLDSVAQTVSSTPKFTANHGANPNNPKTLSFI